MLAVLWLLAKILLLLAGLLLPGAALMRALRLPGSVALGFAGSAVILYVTVLTLQLASVRIALGSLALGLGAVTVVALIVARLRKADVQPAETPSGAGKVTGWAIPYAVFWMVVFWRAWHEPLAGPDVEFRWSFLAEQVLRLGSLDFYPPVSAKDFLSYFWVESIPPGVASLHAWAFACGGSADPHWTMPSTLLQILAVHELLWRAAKHLGGAIASRGTALALAACPLLTWGMLLGQETGLTTLSVAGIVFALERYRATKLTRWAAMAGISAVVGASAREYGMIFPLLAAAGLLAIRAPGRAWLGFVTTALPALIWPMRTWLRTGNPFYSLSVGGLPTNSRFIEWIEHDAVALGASLFSMEGWANIARYLGLFGLTAFVGWIVLVGATGKRVRGAASLLIGTCVVLALWATSVRYTNGGLFYSLRVAAPALAVGALAFGLAIARWPKAHPMALFLAVVTLPATLALPRNPLRTPLGEWPAFAPHVDPAMVDDTVAIVLRTGNPGVVLADSPGFQRRFLPAGVPVIPLWSPQADWLFDRSLSPGEARQRWRESGIRHVILAKWQTNLDFFNTRSRWAQPPFHVQMIGETAQMAVFALSADN